MGTYKFLPHTADEKFKVVAKDLEDAFSTATLAFNEIIVGKLADVKKKLTKKISLKATSIRSLLYDYLNELVFFFDDEDLLLPFVKTMIIKQDSTNEKEEWVLEAELEGDKTYSYNLITEIKNMTYSEMEIKQENNKVELTVVVDI